MTEPLNDVSASHPPGDGRSEAAQRWARVRACFEAALSLPPEQRAAWVRAQAGDPKGLEPAWVPEVLALLAQVTGTEGAGTAGEWSAPPWRVADALGAMEAGDAQDGAEWIGRRLGPWRLVARLGGGGMGEVFEAERADGLFQGRAAVKLLRPELGSPAVLRRFALERQALARLQHPHIARLLDAGLTEEQRPFFVMELVRGQPLDAACAGLGLRERLERFLQLCEAVAHAHRNLLVHRDLKPSNVLVDEQGQVKLLDFGIAKALDPRSEPGAQDQSQFEARPFTPSYASPEQLRGEPVGTATDVYALGLLLCVLLGGQRPYGAEARTPAEAAQAALNDAPVPPSQLNPGWAASLRGDLDNIVLRALAKPVEQRYASVDALAADVRAWLGGFPVSARPATRAYLLAKWLGRHRWGASAGALALVAVLASAGLALWQAHRAEAARQSAVARLANVKRLVKVVLYRFDDALTYVPGGQAAKTAMLIAMNEDLETLAQDPQADPEVWIDLAHSYNRLGEMEADNLGLNLHQPEQALAHARKAIFWFDKASAFAANPDFYIGLGSAWDSVSKVLRSQGQPLEAMKAQDQREQHLRVGLKRWPEEPKLQHALASTFLLKGQLAQSTALVASAGRPQQAREFLAQAVAGFEQILARDPQDAESRHQLGTAHGALALVWRELGQGKPALAESALAVQAMQAAADQQPDNLAHRVALRSELSNRCGLLIEQAQAPALLDACDQAQAVMDALVRDEPGRADFRQNWAFQTLHVGRSLALRQATEQAKALFLQGMAQLEKQTQPSPSVQRRLAWLRTEWAALTSLEALRRVEPQIKPVLAAASPQDRDSALLRARWHEAMANWAGAHERAAQRSAAREAFALAHSLRPLEPALMQRWQALGGAVAKAAPAAPAVQPKPAGDR